MYERVAQLKPAKNSYMVINSSPHVPVQTHTVFKSSVPNGAPNKLAFQWTTTNVSNSEHPK